MGGRLGFDGHGSTYGTGLARPRRGSSIVIGYASALAFWRRVRAEDPAWTRELLGQLYPDDVLSGLSAEDLAADTSLRPLELPSSPIERVRHAARTLGLNEPIDVVVGKHRARRNSKAAICHIWSGPLSNGLVVGVAPGVYVVSPELVLAQMANELGLTKLIMLGMELCGSYSPSRDGCAWDCPPLTDVKRLGWLSSCIDCCRGAKAMRRAGEYILDGAASPMESKLAMLLSLPRSMGGFGCGVPLLNARVELSDSARRESERSYLLADLLFPDAGVDVEYQGKEWHRDDEARWRDEARQNALVMMGMTCLFVSAEHMASERRLESIADTIRSRAGKRGFKSSESASMRFARKALMGERPIVASEPPRWT